MNIKDKWNALSNIDKTRVMRAFIESVDLDNFDYTNQLAFRDKVDKETNFNNTMFPQLEQPCLALELIDGNMTNFITSWLYRRIKVDGVWDDIVPFAGYVVNELHFNKSSLMSYSENEKAILNEAIKILKRKGV